MIKRFLFLIFIGFLVVSIGSAAFAIGANFSLKDPNFGYDHSGTQASNKLTSASVVQVIIGAPGAPDKNNQKGPLLHSGTLSQVQNVGLGFGGAAGQFSLNTNPASMGDMTYLRFWENGAPAENGYYRTFGPYAPADPTPSNNVLGAFQTNYKAAAPYKPLITSFAETKTTMVGGGTSASIVVSSGQPDPTDGYREITEYGWMMWKEGDSEPGGANKTGGVSLNLTSSEVIAGETYNFKVMYGNYFGQVWSDPQKYTIGKGAAGGGPETITYTFQYVQLQNGPMGINTFTFPFTSTASPAAVATMKDLAYAIISQNDPGNAISAVSTIGMWFPDKMWPVGYTITKTGAGTTPADFIFAGGADLKAGGDEPLVKDRAYQISVTRPCTFKITGTR